MLNTAPHVHGLMQRLKPLILLAGLVLAFAATWLSAPNDAAAQDPIDQIKQLYKDGLSQYDFFEYEKANAKYDEAIEIAKTNDVKDPVVAKVYLAKGILFHAQFKDTAPEVAYDKTRDTFISAVSFDYDIEIPEDYYTEELDEILKDARSVVPPPDGDGQDGGDGDGDGGTTTSGDVAVQHTDIGVADACTELEVVANVPPHPDVYRVYVHYRDPEGVSWETLELEPGDDPERFAATLSPKTMVGPKLSYYIEVVNRQRAAVATVGTRSQPNEVTVVGECELESEEVPLVHIFVSAGTGFGLANGDAERCPETPECYGDDPERFDGVKSGVAPAPFHTNVELMFNLLEELQLGVYGRIQIVEFGYMIGAKLRYFIASTQPHRFYTGLGIGYGNAAFVVDLGPDFNNFRDIVRAEGPAHIGLNLGYAVTFHKNVGLQIDVFTPIHFPEFTFHFDLSVGPFFQF